MRRHERLSAVLELVAGAGSLSVEDVSATFGVSPATARRDLDDLAGQQLVSRTRGGAVAHSVTYDLPLRYKTGRQADAKQRIGAAAAALVTPDLVIGLNGGTTTTEVARCLAGRADLAADDRQSLPATTVVTNALNIANELAVRPRIRTVVIGGVLRPQSYELIGPFARPVLDGVALDLVFLGVDGLTVADGAAAAHEGEAQINEVMVSRAARVVVVADGSKLGRRAFCTICPVERLDVVITDGSADPRVVADLRDAGLDVQTV